MVVRVRAPRIKTYKYRARVIGGLKRAGLLPLPYTIIRHSAPDSFGYTAKVRVDTPQDADEVRVRGFIPELTGEV